MPNTSLNMGLPIPITAVDSGLVWEQSVAAALGIIDGHNHSSGSGTQINPSGIDISTDLGFNSQNATMLRSVRFTAQATPISAPTDLGCLYEVGVDLYYNDGSGNQIRITQGGSVAGSAGTITGLPSGTASAAYSAGTFIFQQATNTAANIDVASVILRNTTANSKGLTLQPPAAMGANYSLTLPSIPSTNSFMTIDSAGNMGTGPAVNNPNFSGKAVQEAGLNVIVSNTNASQSLSVVRGMFYWNGTSLVGVTIEGCTVSRLGTGVYFVSYTTPFGDAAVPVVSIMELSANPTSIVGLSVTHPPTTLGFGIVAGSINTPLDQVGVYIAFHVFGLRA